MGNGQGSLPTAATQALGQIPQTAGSFPRQGKNALTAPKTVTEEVDADLVVLFAEHKGHSQRIATIVAWTGKDDNGRGG